MYFWLGGYSLQTVSSSFMFNAALETAATLYSIAFSSFCVIFVAIYASNDSTSFRNDICLFRSFVCFDVNFIYFSFIFVNLVKILLC